MPAKGPAKNATPRRVLVAGDVCLDVVAVPIPPKSAESGAENWRLTGETRTHFLPGGAMLLAKFIRSSRLAAPIANAEEKAREEIRKKGLKGDDAKQCRYEIRNEARLTNTREAEEGVVGPRPRMPDAIVGEKRELLYQDEFLSIAERLCRDEIVHSLIGAKFFPTTLNSDNKSTTLRVEREYGYSGPVNADQHPSLKVEYPPHSPDAPPPIIVLDDTGNRFRREGDNLNPWPAAIKSIGGRGTPDDAGEKPLILYKLHRPLPSVESETTTDNKLWDAVGENHPHNRIVIVSIDDFRVAGAPISMGLSWERTALDVVWHLAHTDAFTALLKCPRLVIRLGLDGAILWQSDGDNEMSRKAWLIYDPQCIEGGFGLQVLGQMVSCGSAFTAAFAERLAVAEDETFCALLQPVEIGPKGAAAEDAERLLVAAVIDGLRASRRLLQLGFGDYSARPNYPGPELFQDGETGAFFAHPIKIIPGANEPDRSYWRLLDSVFEKKRDLLHKAVALTATGQERGAGNDKEEEENALALLKRVPLARFGALRTYDRSEIEHYRALHTLLRDYLCARVTPRPLSLAVFGAPGAGKSFGVKQVAKSLKGQRDCKEVEELTFNLSLFQKPEDLAGAFHLVRDVALRGKVSLVFFDEFDTSLDGTPLGWLRHFLAPMQDGEFLDRGAPHPIGQAIFVFAGGTCATYREFSSHPGMDDAKFRAVKGPDFLSRLRHALDIPSLNFLTADEPLMTRGERIQPRGTFNPYGPIEEFPCEAAILLRRAAILEHNLREKAPELIRADKSLAVTPEVLRPLLRLPQFQHGNRSFEALLDMSHLVGASAYAPSLLPPAFQIPLHADAQHLGQLVATDFPFPPQDRLVIAKSIHERYLKSSAAKKNTDPTALLGWDDPAFAPHQAANLEQAGHIAEKLRSVGLWCRKLPKSSQTRTAKTAAVTRGAELLKPHLEILAKAEHDRWSAQKRRQGWAAGHDTSIGSKNEDLMLHNCLFPWDLLSDDQRDIDRQSVADIPLHLATVNYEIFETGGQSK